jgi:hypothetical protein
MDPELRRYIQQSSFEQAAIRHVRTMLPDETELDRWLEQTAGDYACDEFIFLLVAAMAAGRAIHARHLGKGAAILASIDLLPEIAMKMTGNVPEYLMHALQNTIISHKGRAYALAVVAVQHKERGEDVPPGVYSMARSIAHFPNLERDALPALHGLAMYLHDEELTRFLRRTYFPKVSEEWWRARCDVARTFGSEILKMGATPVSELIPEKGERMLAVGSMTMRRSVPRIGRNEPCHCGSGKKYKHCCFEADRERLRQSSDIEGVTLQEREELPEEYLTANRLKTMAVTELLAIDPLRVPYELLGYYFARFADWKEFDRAAEAFEKIGYIEEFDATWNSLVFLSAFYGRKDAFTRLIALRRDAGIPDTELSTTYRLLPIEDDPVKSWEWIDSETMSVLRSGDVDDLRNFALGLLLTKHRALGILLCRGVVPLLSSAADVASMVDYVLGARNQLSLDPDDPITDIADKLSAANDEALETDSALRETRELLELKRREASELKQSLERLRRDMKRREEALVQIAQTEAPEAPKAAAGPGERDLLRELRRKMQNVEQELRERNAERNSLRRDLHEKQLEVDAFRDRAETEAKQAEADSETSAEDDLLLPQESKIHHPLRLIEFPRNFEQRLNAVPRNIARAALAALGRLAGGEPAAFVGAVRLKACPSVTRQRIGIDHRLLFRLLPDRIQVLDLIPRSDLERKVKILATQYD